MYTLTKIPPKKGNFLRIWEYNNTVWSDTFIWKSPTNLVVYDDEQDKFINYAVSDFESPSSDMQNIRYIIMGED